MTLTQGAYEWSSAHRPIIFTYAYQTQTIASISNDAGYAKVVISSAFDTPPTVGDRLILSSTTLAAYNGIYKILIVNSTTSFTIDTPYTIADILTGNCKFIKIPVFQLYVGYDTGETYDTELPLALVATFTPINSPQGNVQIDLSGFLKSTFTITPPDGTTGVDFTVWNRYRLFVDEEFSADYYVINASVEQDYLNNYFVKTGRYLMAYDKFILGTPENYQFLQGCGKTLVYRIQGNTVVKYIAEDGATAGIGEGNGGDTDPEV